MKNTRILAIAVAAIAMAACEKERTPENVTQVNPNLVEFTISGGAEAGAIVRSAFGKEYPTIEWKTGDKISVIGSKTGNQPFEAKTSGVSTDFDGLLDLEDEVLYAVYPYDANITIPTAPTSYNEELINVSIPSVQYATDGSFDPNAYVAVAKSTDKKFAFKSIVGFLKFQLEDGENVKSVRIVANNDAADKSTTIATAAAVKFYDNGLPTHGMTSWANSTNTITLIEKDGGDQFKSDTDYFITLKAHTLPTGLQIYVEYDNGTIYKKGTSSQIFPTGQARNSIMYMGIFGKSHKFTQVNDLYSLYNMGYDIPVGDITINCTDYGAAKYTELTNENTTDLTTTLKTGGVHFLSAEDGANFTITGYVETGNNLIIINSNTGTKIGYTHSTSHTFNHNNTIIAMKGIEINLGTKYLINNSKAADASGKIIFDDCKFSNVGSNIYYGSKKDVGMALIQLQTCDIVTTAAIQLINLNTTTVMNDYMTIKCNDCTFSSASLQNFVLINSASPNQTATDPTSVIEVKNCSFHNLRPNKSYINVPWCANMKFNKNLISVYSLTQDGTMAAVNSDTGNLSVIDAGDNYYYVNNFNGKTLKAVSSNTESVTSESSYPFNTTTFQVWAAYAGYGAKR